MGDAAVPVISAGQEREATPRGRWTSEEGVKESCRNATKQSGPAGEAAGTRTPLAFQETVFTKSLTTGQRRPWATVGQNSLRKKGVAGAAAQ